MQQPVRFGCAQARIGVIRANERCISPSDEVGVQQRKRLPAARLAAASALVACAVAVASAAPVRAQPEAERTGTGFDALPGVHEVPLALRNPSGFGARLGLGYGWSGSVLEEDDSHHRLQLDGAASVTPLAWLSTSLRVLGRYDWHSGGDLDDSGAITETRLAARATFPLGGSWHAGGELALWLPAGETVGRAFAALSGDLRLLLAFAPERSPLRLGLALGLRMDRSQYAGGDPENYSAADRLALGVSDTIGAALGGLSFSYLAGLEWVAEWYMKSYFGHVAESPMWFRAGARHRPSAAWQLELLLGVSPSKRPSLADDAPLAVIEPRLWAGLAATYVWPIRSPPPVVAPPPVEAPVQAVVKPPPTLGGQVLSPSGTGHAGATLTLTQGGQTQTTTSDAQGAFTFGPVAPGQYTLSALAEGFNAEPLTLDWHEGAAEPRITLKRELPRGQIRGTVRRFNGAPVVATVEIKTLELSRQTQADGTFEFDVPPGDYSVQVRARGFRPQTRKAHVDLHGVAIVIVELEVAK